MGDSTLQAFRAQWSSKVVAIPTRLDPKNGQPIIRWKDVIQYFQNAECIMNGEHMVLFLTDENLEEIAHHPGVVLEVVISTGYRRLSNSLNTSNVSNTNPVGSSLFSSSLSNTASPVGSSLFSSTLNNTNGRGASSSGGLFGNPTPPSNTGGLFGSPTPASSTGGLFGNPTPASSGGLFGNSMPASSTSGLFRSSTPGSYTGGLFGNAVPASDSSSSSSTLNNNGPVGSSMFSSRLWNGSSPLGSSLFNSTLNNAGNPTSNVPSAAMSASSETTLSDGEPQTFAKARAQVSGTDASTNTSTIIPSNSPCANCGNCSSGTRDRYRYAPFSRRRLNISFRRSHWSAPSSPGYTPRHRSLQRADSRQPTGSRSSQREPSVESMS